MENAKKTIRIQGQPQPPSSPLPSSRSWAPPLSAPTLPSAVRTDSLSLSIVQMRIASPSSVRSSPCRVPSLLRSSSFNRRSRTPTDFLLSPQREDGWCCYVRACPCRSRRVRPSFPLFLVDFPADSLLVPLLQARWGDHSYRWRQGDDSGLRGDVGNDDRRPGVANGQAFVG
jgi:hypothetical protein